MGEKFKQEGLKALGRTTIFGFGKQQKFEDACAAFVKAGSAYKMSKDWLDAGEMYIKAAECQQEIDNRSEACNYYVEAGGCYVKTTNPRSAIEPYLKAIEIYTEASRLSPIARYYKEIAEILEKERAFSEAIEYYEKAGDVNEADNKKQQKSQCMLKVATLCSQEGDLSRAAAIFETLGNEAMETKLGSYSAKGYFFQCVLCHMALGDFVASKAKTDAFKSADFNFPSSRECQFLSQLQEAIDGFNADAFSQACSDFDRITPLDPWKTSVLVKVKAHIADSSGGDVDLS